MSVGTTQWPDFRAYENRGIFRNPLSLLDGTHRGISLTLHGFTARVMKTTLDRNMKFLYVNALDSMKNLLSRRLGDSVVTNPQKMYEIFMSLFPDLHTGEYFSIPLVLETPLFIPIESLLTLFPEPVSRTTKQRVSRSSRGYRRRRTKKNKRSKSYRKNRR